VDGAWYVVASVIICTTAVLALALVRPALFFLRLLALLNIPFVLAAPEIMQAGKFTAPSDVYSLGVILWEILTGGEPWEDAVSIQAIERAVLSGRHLPIVGIPPELATLLLRMWNQHPKDRPTAKQVTAELLAFKEQEGLNVEEPASLPHQPPSGFPTGFHQSAPGPTTKSSLKASEGTRTTFSSSSPAFDPETPQMVQTPPMVSKVPANVQYSPNDQVYCTNAQVSATNFKSYQPGNAQEARCCECCGLKRRTWIIIGAVVGVVLLIIIIAVAVAAGGDDGDDIVCSADGYCCGGGYCCNAYEECFCDAGYCKSSGGSYCYECSV